MKKINIFYIILVLWAIVMSAFVLVRDAKRSLQPAGTMMEIMQVDTVYVTKVVHDTVYIERDPSPEPADPLECFLGEFRQIFKEELFPFYREYAELTEENIEAGKARFEECEKNAKVRYDVLVDRFIQDNPEEVDYINNLVSKELTKAMKPYLHMLNDYGNRK